MSEDKDKHELDDTSKLIELVAMLLAFAICFGLFFKIIFF